MAWTMCDHDTFGSTAVDAATFSAVLSDTRSPTPLCWIAARRGRARAAGCFTSLRRNSLTSSTDLRRARASQARTNAPSATRGASETASPSSWRACASSDWNSASKILWSASGFGSTADVEAVGDIVGQGYGWGERGAGKTYATGRRGATAVQLFASACSVANRRLPDASTSQR